LKPPDVMSVFPEYAAQKPGNLFYIFELA